MSDLISRQVAIDALKAAYWDKNIQSAKDDPCIVDAMTDWAIRQIKALPSARPSVWKSASIKPETDGMYLTLWGLTEKSRLHYKLLYYGTCEDWNDFFIKKSGWWDFDYGYGVPDFIDNDNVRYWMGLPDMPEVDE